MTNIYTCSIRIGPPVLCARGELGDYRQKVQHFSLVWGLKCHKMPQTESEGECVSSWTGDIELNYSFYCRVRSKCGCSEDVLLKHTEGQL